MAWAAQKCQGMITSAPSRVSRVVWFSNITQQDKFTVLICREQIFQVSSPLFRFISLTMQGRDRVLPIPAQIPLLLPLGNSPNFPHLLPRLTTNFSLFYMLIVLNLHDIVTQTLLRPKKHPHMAVKTINQFFLLTNDECSTACKGTYTFSAGT